MTIHNDCENDAENPALDDQPPVAGWLWLAAMAIFSTLIAWPLPTLIVIATLGLIVGGLAWAKALQLRAVPKGVGDE